MDQSRKPIAFQPEKPGQPNIAERAKLEKETDNMSKIHVLMVLMYFAGLFLILFYYSLTFLTLNGLLKIFAVILTASFVVPIKLYRLRYSMSFYEYTIGNILSLSPLLCGLILLLNFHFSSEVVTEVHKIKNLSKQNNTILLQLENDAYEEESFVRSFDEAEFSANFSSDSLELHLANGLFGYKVLKKRKLI